MKKPEPKPEPKKEVKQDELISLLDQPVEEEKAPEIVLSKDVLVMKDTRNGESFYLNDDLAINVMVVSKTLIFYIISMQFFE